MEMQHTLVAVEDVRPGEHIGLVYEQADERLAVLVLFIMAGLKRGEKVRVVAAGLQESLVGPLAQAGVDPGTVMERRQLVTHPALPDWRAGADVAAWLHRETARALAEGYTGLRIAIETFDSAGGADSPLLSSAELEAGLDIGLSDSLCAVLCLYQRADLEATGQLWNLLAAHSSVATAAGIPELSSPQPQVEAMLREREAYHVSFFENGFEPMLLIDPRTGEIVDANPAACDFYGYPREVLKTLRITSINMLPPKTIFQEMERSRNGERSRFEFRHRLADGQIRAVEVHSGPIRRHGRELIYSIVHDVTEHRWTEQALRESEERLSHLLETVPSGIIFATPDGRLQFMNAAAEQILGVTAEEAARLSYADLQARVTDLDGALLPDDALTFGRVVVRNEPVYGFQCAVRRLDESVVYISVSSAPLHGPEGEVQGVVSSLTDITPQLQAEAEQRRLLEQMNRERRRAETLAAESRKEAEKWDAVFRALTDAVVILDAQGVIVGANPAARRMCATDLVSLNKEDQIQKIPLHYPDGRALARPEDYPAFRALEGETVIGGQYFLTNAKGREIPVLTSAAPIHGNGRVSGAVVVWHDMTEREQFFRQAEQERERNTQLAAEAGREAERLKAVFSALVDLVVLIDVDGRMIGANPAAVRFFEMDPTQTDRATLGRKLAVRNLEGQPIELAEFPSSRALRGEVVAGARFIVRGPGGRDAMMEISATPIREAGRIMGAVSTWHDVTEREQLLRQVEEERRRVEKLATMAQQQAAKLTTVFNAIHEAITILDPSGKIISANPAAVRLYGVDPLGVDWPTAFRKLSIRRADGRPMQSIAEMPSYRAAHGETVIGERYLFTNAQGKEIAILVSVAPIYDAGQFIGTVSVWHDVTEHEQLRRQMEREHQLTRQLADKWNAVFNSMTDAVFLYDATGRLISTNPEASRLCGVENLPGYGRERIIRDLLLRYPDGRLLERIEDAPSSRALLGEVITNERFAFTNAEGKETLVLISASPLWEEDAVIGAVAVWHDVTEREALLQQVEQERQRAEAQAAQLNAIFNVMTDIVMFVDAEGRVVRANPATERAFGVNPMIDRVALGKRLNIRHLDGRPLHPDEFYSSRALRGEVVLNDRVIYTNGEGQAVISAVSAVPLREEERIIGAVTIWRDVTEREQLLQQIEQNRQLLQTMIDTMPMGVVAVDAKGNLLLRNPASEAILGSAFYRQAQRNYMGDYTLHRLDGTQVPGAEGPLGRALLRGESSAYEELRVRRGDGVEMVVEISANPIRDEAGWIQGAVAIFQDVTARKQVEVEQERLLAELDAERRRLRTILDTLPVGVFVADAKGAELESNAMTARIWGGELPEIEGKEEYGVYKAWWAETGEPVTAESWALSRALNRGEISISEVLDIERFDGTSGTILNSAAPIMDGEGRIIGAVAVLQDITRQRRMEREALERRRRFEALAQELETVLETIDVGVAVTDCNHRVVKINRALSSRLNLSLEEILGQPLSALSGHTEFDAFRQQVLETGESLAWKAVAFGPGFWDMRMAPIYGIDGFPVQVLMTYTNVTEHVRARQEAELDRARWLTTLNTIPLPVIFIDSARVVRVVNAAARVLWHDLSVGESWTDVMEACCYLDVVTGVEIPRADHPISRALRGETVRDFEAILVQEDGRRVPLLLYAASVLMENQVVGAILVGQDLTRLKEADRIKDQFLAMVSLDLRSPLATIKGWALVAQESYDLAIIQKALDLILKGAQTQQRLIDDLLDSAALAVGTLRVSREVQDLQPIVELVCQGAQATGAERGITLTWELPAEPLAAGVDGVRLQQILGNLIANAYKFTPRGGRVEVRLDREEDLAVLTVRDTGRGISADYLPHIFDRFYSQAGSQQPTSRSLGLGLAIVKALVELHGGTVSAWSAGEQQGSIFTVRLPLP